MIDYERISKLIENGYECEYLDFKKLQYRRENFHELIIDIMSMSNSSHMGDKYIILGIKDKPDGTRDICGIPKEDLLDSSIYQNVIIDNIEPEIKFDYFPIEYQDKWLGIIKIHANNTDKPYMLKKRYKELYEGMCKVRKGSNNSNSTRKDYDSFYISKEQFEVKFMENSLTATKDDLGCARTSVTIRNLTKKPVVINYGRLSVINKDSQILSEHRVYGFGENIVGADFQLTLSPMEEKLGNIYVGFESSDCFRIGINEDGITFEKFIFKLVLSDTFNNEYTCQINNGWVLVKGAFLWKVKLEAEKERKKNKGRI